MTTAMAACTGLGALPYLFLGRGGRGGAGASSAGLSPRATALATAVACGVMLAAAFDLIHEGEPGGGGAVTAGVLAGAAFVAAAQAKLSRFEHVKLEAMLGGCSAADGRRASGGTGAASRATAARKNVLVVAIMAAHALGEGSGVGVSFCGRRGWAQGVLVTLAIGLHNVPEGLATATALVARGVSPVSALWWTLATAAPQPLVALPAFLFVDAFRAALPLAMGFAAGCMIWMVADELLPDALAAGGGGGGTLSRAASADGGGGAGPPSSQAVASPAEIATVLTVSAAGLEALRMALAATLETPTGGLAPPMAAATGAAAAARAVPGALLGLAVAAASGACGAAASGRWLMPAAGTGALGLGAGAVGWVGLASAAGAVRAGGLTAFAAATLGGAALWSGLQASGTGRASSSDGGFFAPARSASRSHYHHLIAGPGSASGPASVPPPADLPTHIDSAGQALAGSGKASSLRSVGLALGVLAAHGAVLGWAAPASTLAAPAALVPALARSALAGGLVAAFLWRSSGPAKGAARPPPLLAGGASLAVVRPLAAALAAAAGLAPPPPPSQALDGTAAPAGVSPVKGGGPGPLAGLAVPAVSGALLAVAAAVLLPAALAATKPRLAGRAAFVGVVLAAVAWGLGA